MRAGRRARLLELADKVTAATTALADVPPAGPADPGLLAAVDVPGVRDLALDAAALSEESRAVVHAMAVRLRELEAGAVTPSRRRGRSR